MPVAPTYPGVYIEELPSAVRTIIGVPTSTTAFVGPALRGPLDEAGHITSWGDFERRYGGLDPAYPMSYSVYQYYLNGGSEAEIVRVASGAAAATLDLGNGVILEARSPGAWGDQLRARVDHDTKDPADMNLWNLTVRDVKTGDEERFLNIDASNADSSQRLDRVLSTSRFVRMPAANAVLNARPAQSAPFAPGADPFATPAAGGNGNGGGGGGGGNGGGNDGGGGGGGAGGGGGGGAVAYVQAANGQPGAAPDLNAYVGNRQDTGMYALRRAPIINILCIPPVSFGTATVPDGLLVDALKLCVDERAILLVDPPPGWTTLDTAAGGLAALGLSGEDAKNAALYFPRVSMIDPILGTPREFVPSGAIAGVIARIDGQRGVWKAPAGTDASITGVRDLAIKLTDLENGRLNPIAINSIRTFPIIGTVVWGARTLRGADALADQWKYLPVRRTALFIEETLYRGTTWAVFEPNAEPLWSSLRLNIGAFMNSLWRQGAFFGETARDAYIVKCDAENNPQNDIDRGIVNILVGFRPLKPAEFVLIHIQQLAGQLET